MKRIKTVLIHIILGSVLGLIIAGAFQLVSVLLFWLILYGDNTWPDATQLILKEQFLLVGIIIGFLIGLFKGLRKNIN